MASWSDLLDYSLTSLRHRSLRSWLTVLGIVIGIAAIVSLIAIAQGLELTVKEQISAFGPRLVAVVPGDINKQVASFQGGPNRPPSAGKLFENDAKRLDRIPGVERLSQVLVIRSAVSYQGQSVSTSVGGVQPEVFTYQVLNLSEGRYLVDGDRRVVVVGAAVADGSSVFKKTLGVGSTLRLGTQGTPFRVVGVLSKAGNIGGSTSDQVIYIPIDDARELAGDSIAQHEITGIRFMVAEGFDINQTLDAAEAELMSAHHVNADDKDFSLVTSDFILKTIGAVLGVVTLTLGLVASISLLVGGIGVANTMSMSVLERTREIGTLKAIGASDGVVMRLFLIESALIGMAGGLIGLFIGWLLSLAIGLFGFQAVVSPVLALGAIFFSAIVGLVAGLMPARRAAQMPPMEALRYE
ncbi:MacB-like periplasmic core domain protein [uncultured archaeon]|nr:MacB-like periplasmic core domain protein [uncultured archaeon]